MPGRKAVTFSGKPSPASAMSASRHSASIACVGVEQPLDSSAVRRVGHPHRREPGAMKDLVGVGVADAAEERRVGEGALERVPFRARAGAKGVDDPPSSTSSPPGSIAASRGVAARHVQRRAPRGAGLGEDERTRRRRRARPGRVCFGIGAPAAQPPQAAGDHQVKDHGNRRRRRTRCACRDGARGDRAADQRVDRRRRRAHAGTGSAMRTPRHAAERAAGAGHAGRARCPAAPAPDLTKAARRSSRQDAGRPDACGG